jgi:hypothetical protein
MPWTYKHNPTLKIAEVAYSGSTTARDLRESTSEFIALEKEKGIYRFLIDTSEHACFEDISSLRVSFPSFHTISDFIKYIRS